MQPICYLELLVLINHIYSIFLFKIFHVSIPCDYWYDPWASSFILIGCDSFCIFTLEHILEEMKCESFFWDYGETLNFSPEGLSCNFENDVKAGLD